MSTTETENQSTDSTEENHYRAHEERGVVAF